MPGANRNPEQPRKLAKIEQSDNTQKIKIDTIEEVVDNGIDLEELGISQDLVDRYFDLVNEEVPEDEEHAKNYAIRVGYFIQDAINEKLRSCLNCDENDELTVKPHYDKNGTNGATIHVKYFTETKSSKVFLYEDFYNEAWGDIQLFGNHTFTSTIGRPISDAEQQFEISREDSEDSPKIIIMKSGDALGRISKMLSASFTRDNKGNIKESYRSIDSKTDAIYHINNSEEAKGFEPTD